MLKKIFGGEELHPPFMNFMGPGSKVEDRLSLNYKGKRGTKNYMIPSTYSDYVSFEHDLLYWSPDNVVKAYADAKFLTDIRSIIGLGGIALRYMQRLGIEGLINYKLFESSIRQLKTVTKTISKTPRNIKKISLDLRDKKKKLREAFNIATFLDEQNIMDEMKGMTDATQLQALQELKKGLTTAKLNYYAQRRSLIYNVGFRIIPSLLFSGYLINNNIIPAAKSIADNLRSYFIINPEYEEIQKQVDLVKEKLDNYLKTVGEWEDAPFFKSLVFRKEKLFNVKDGYNEIEAEKAYVDFYEQFKKYMIFMNDFYKGNPDYVPFEVKNLNLDNIDKVKKIKDVDKMFFENWAKKQKKTYEIKDGDLNKTQLKNFTTSINEIKKNLNIALRKDKETYGEIQKVLSGEIKRPFETPAEKEEEIKLNEENQKLIDEIFKEQEIEKVLKGEQEQLFETPIQIENILSGEEIKSIYENQDELSNLLKELFE